MNRINPDIIRLKDILNAINDIENFATEELEDRKTLMATAYTIAIIGESASKLSKEITDKYSHIPWKQIVGMRHRIIHDYGNVDINNLKQTVKKDIPLLKSQIEEILSEIKN